MKAIALKKVGAMTKFRLLNYKSFLTGLAENPNFMLNILKKDSPLLKLLHLDSQIFMTIKSNGNNVNDDIS